MRTAFLTGATGYVGCHLARGLIAANWRVIALIRPQSVISGLEGVSAVVHDGSTESMIQILSDAKPDVCIHVASLVIPEHNAAQIAPMITSNILLGAQLLEGMLHAGIRRLINTGTSWQHYGGAEYDPVCLYAATKQAFEALLAYYVNAHDFVAITLDLCDTYGPGDKRQKIFHLIEQAARTGKRLSMSPGEQLIDILHIDDVVSAYICATDQVLASEHAHHDRFMLSSGQPKPLRELVSDFARIKGVSLDINWGGRPYRRREVMNPWLGGRLLSGWSPRISLEEGIKSLT